MLPFILMLAQIVPPAPAVDPRAGRMAALYGEVCLRAFPDYAAVDRVMAGKGATALTPEEVRVTLRADPGRGWSLADGDRQVLVFLELPPFHACSVRWSAPAGATDLSAYRAAIAPLAGAGSGFRAIPPQEADMGPIHISATGLERSLAGGGIETLFVIDQHITDPARRAAGETGVSRRFVRQHAPGR